MCIRDRHCIFLNAKNVTKTGLDLTNLQFISEEKDSSLRKGKLDRNDIIVTTRGTVGNFAYYSTLVPYEHIRINSGMVILRNTSSQIDTRLLYRLMKLGYFKHEISKHAYGSAQPQLSVKIIESLKIPFYNDENKKRINSMLDKFEALGAASDEKLDATKKALISLNLAVLGE